MKNFEEIYNLIDEIYNNIKIILYKAYYNKRYINFIYGKKFNLFFDYFINRKKNINLEFFLYYFTNNSNIQSTDHKCNNLILNLNKDPKIEFIQFYQNLIEQIEIFLNNILIRNKLNINNIYEQNYIKKEFRKYFGIYLTNCSNLEIEIIQYYKYFTNNVPLANTLLLCNEITTSEEIISFLYRTILCKQNILFCLGRFECLSKDKKNIVLETINNLFERFQNDNNYYKNNSLLLIACTNSEDDLYKSLYKLKIVKPLDIQRDKIKDIKTYEKSNLLNNNLIPLIIYSDHSGVGKSTYIRNLTKINYIYFPIGGIFTKENILKRLQTINKEKSINKNKKAIFHVDLYDTDLKSLMNDFLYFILITRLYSEENNIFYLSKDVKIYIEVPNSFINFFQKFPILDLFPKKLLSIDNLEPLIVPNDISSNIKIVSIYLKYLKEESDNNSFNIKSNKIDKNEIIFPFTSNDIILVGNEYNYNKIILKAEDENKNLTQKVCQQLIMDEIKVTIPKPTYYQITTFIDVLANQLIQFNRNFYLSACTIIDSGKFSNCCVRSLIVKKFIELTRYFTKGAFTELLNEQKETQSFLTNKYNEKEEMLKANKILESYKHDSISYDRMDLALVLFHGGDNSNYFSIITNKKPEDKDYIDLLNLKNFQSGKDIIKKIKTDNKNKMKIINQNVEKLANYKEYNQYDFLEELKEILDLKNTLTKSDDKEKISLIEIAKDYVFTVDNFIKMCLILIRLRAKIPVIMMGETGCGKTSLIRKLSELQNNGKCLLVIDNIHAGHSDQDIIDFLEKKVIPEAKSLSIQEKIKKTKYEKVKEIYEEKKLWVFFDELNTCKSMDLLSEIICKHSYYGKLLPENIVFIGACNPYRKSKQKRIGLKINNDNINYEESDLIYTVNPLPHSLLNYVFDFGSLNSEDEKKYINNMVKLVIKEENLYKLSTELIFVAQNYIRSKNDISSVSLREIRRFIIFYEFFLDYLNKKKQIFLENNFKENIIKYSKLSEYEIKLYSINLAIYLGYYLRLTEDNENTQEKGLRECLHQKLNEIYIKESQIDFLIVPQNEEHFIADNVELEKGIAKNRALLENLFSLFVAINTKVPIFILGKPGCSKSLSIQLINNAMKGKMSKSKIFQKYPKMYVSTYQGSLNSTSEGIKAIFEKAREILKVSKNKEKISTVYFDEMGLAEHSPHNPLKVIHSELEYDLNEDDKKISFIGVSNWTLDSSKMNRGITINIPDPNDEDIKTTSKTIAYSYLEEKLKDNIILFFENLGLGYYNYKKEFKISGLIKKYEDFHGNRDFYHLIKYSATQIKSNLQNNKKIDDILLANLAIKGLGRNFGGLYINEDKYTTGLNLFIEKLSINNLYLKNIVKERKIFDNIEEKILDNLNIIKNDYLSRYLLLISKSNIGIYLLSSFLKSINKENKDNKNYIIYIGSMFIDD